MASSTTRTVAARVPNHIARELESISHATGKPMSRVIADALAAHLAATTQHA